MHSSLPDEGQKRDHKVLGHQETHQTDRGHQCQTQGRAEKIEGGEQEVEARGGECRKGAPEDE